ncbi:hypothetical protein CONLIGDRAFT_652440 [Coniochaeta ligniaria NRRL 30616]|uniref:DUF5672 domain-containing protein n=1 Tax=Coniochaeta ligniaria NRRL 30616 TaxID=1408157 RepID=A0A1J7J1Y1_9PEZI|nr:hypothetical protein CONLIGDRAFT_652440 [Coniochaeta ligniaria NRRL 30616]
MANAHSPHSPGIFAITKLKLFVLVSLSFTWWFASNLPHYKPMIRAGIKSRIDEARQKIPTIKVDWAQETSTDPRDAYNSSKVALLIEPRPLPHLVPQILHMISVVPPDWRFVFIGSNLSVVTVARAYATKHQQVIGKLDLMVLPEPWEIESKEKVYRLLTDMRFYDEFLPGVEWLLKYESDSILCANSEESLNDWLDWHWAGAPRTPDDRFSGNGGLSLRRVSAIRRVLNFQARYNNTQPEDEWFGTRVYILPGAKVASGSDGMLAVEDVYKENAMGFHVRNGGTQLADAVWKDRKQRQAIFNYCPELSLIMDMKLERERCPGDDKEGEIHPTAEEKAAEAAKQAEEQRRKAEAEARRKAAEAAEAAKTAAVVNGTAVPGADAEEEEEVEEESPEGEDSED